MIITTTASRPFEKIYMDIVGPLTKSYNGNVFILTLQDDLSKFAWAVPMPNHEANTVAKFFVTQFVCLHGLPQSLVTDCGTEFLSKEFKEVCQLLKIKQTSTSPYHPQSNGSLERSHRTLAEYLRSFVKKDPQNWDTHVPFAMFCHNSTTHTSTKYQPYQLVYGHPITVPNSFMKNTEPQYNYNDYYFELKRNMQEAQAQAKTHLYDSKQKSKERYDQKISHLTISIGDKVLIQEKSSKVGHVQPQRTIESDHQDRPSTPEYTITPITEHQGLYYESHGQVGLSHLTWDLVVYVNLNEQLAEYDVLKSHYHKTAQYCTDHSEKEEFSSICKPFLQQFTRATLPYLYEIESNYRSLMIAIDYDQQTAKKSRRGLGSAVNRITNVIYGMCSRINTDFIVDNIIELSKNKLKNLNLIHDRTRISEVETTETNRTLKSLKIHQQQIEENLKHLQQQIENNTQNINLMSFKTKLLEQAFLFEVILNKFSYDTQNLMAIVNAALNGKIYTSALTSQTLMSELREIKMNLPMGSILPIEITTESLTEFLRISEITIFTQKNYLIFVIEIPLLSNEKYTVYHPIPLPIPHTDRTIVLIDTEVEYLALSSDNEKFFTLSTEQWEKCKSLGLDKLCKQDSLIHHRLGSDSCEVSLLTDPQPFPKTCNLKFISLNANIWHKLTKTNTWLYYTQHSTLGTISCSNSLEKFQIEINNVGRITISKFCKNKH
ncbi:hypothetical protein QTP88_029555 [Uroleucon formosanum]